MKYRWLDTEYPVRCCGRRSHYRGREGRLVLLPTQGPGRRQNALVDFDGDLAVVPAATLRSVKP
ncbi:MAG: hypothetical protein JW990_00190 [Thermoleophilia bacterium]|nr:hypothetical protein [Thermoleophilia bacterium]